MPIWSTRCVPKCECRDAVRCNSTTLPVGHFATDRMTKACAASKDTQDGAWQSFCQFLVLECCWQTSLSSAPPQPSRHGNAFLMLQVVSRSLCGYSKEPLLIFFFHGIWIRMHTHSRLATRSLHRLLLTWQFIQSVWLLSHRSFILLQTKEDDCLYSHEPFLNRRSFLHPYDLSSVAIERAHKARKHGRLSLSASLILNRRLHQTWLGKCPKMHFILLSKWLIRHGEERALV